MAVVREKGQSWEVVAMMEKMRNWAAEVKVGQVQQAELGQLQRKVLAARRELAAADTELQRSCGALRVAGVKLQAVQEQLGSFVEVEEARKLRW